MAHNYTRQSTSGNWTVAVSPSTNYGYFEYFKVVNGIEHQCEGGLWFSGRSLIDYDGVFELPANVATSLIALGYTVDKEFMPDAKPTNQA